jgi:uncharacterized protein
MKKIIPIALLILTANLAIETIPQTIARESKLQPQKLPIGAELIIGKQKILLEVTRTPQEGQIGLMYRTKLANDRGMMFPFEPAQPVKFWMKNTLIPLDIIFVKDGKVEHIEAKVPPCKSDPCPTYGPDESIKIDRVIELGSGRAKVLNFKVGDRLNLRDLNPVKKMPDVPVK